MFVRLDRKNKYILDIEPWGSIGLPILKQVGPSRQICPFLTSRPAHRSRFSDLSHGDFPDWNLHSEMNNSKKILNFIVL